MRTPKSQTRSTGRHTLDGTVWGFLAEAVALPSALLTVAYLTRHLGADGYGLFALSAGLMVWVHGVLNALLQSTTVKFASEAGEGWGPLGSLVLRLYLLGGLTTGALIIAFAPAIAGALGEPSMAAHLRLFALDLPLSAAAAAHEHLLVGVGHYRGRAGARAAWWIGRLLFIVLLVSLGFSVAGAIVGSMAATTAQLLVARRLVKPALFGGGRFPLRRLLSYAGPLLVSGLAFRFLRWADLFVLKGLGASAAEAGFYAAAQNLAQVPGLFAVAVAPLVLSSLTRALGTERAEEAQQLGRDAWRFAFVLLPFGALGAGAAPGIVRFVYGAEFAAAAPLLAILIMGVIAAVIKSIGSSMLVASGRPRWVTALSVPLVPLALAGYALLIPPMGALGAATVTAGVFGIGAVAFVGAAYCAVGIRPPTLTVLRSLLASGLAYAAAAAWTATGAWFLPSLLVLAAGLLLLLRLLGEISDADVKAFLSLFPWRLHAADS